MSRGNRKEALYRDRDDYETFMKLLELASKNCFVKIHSFCLMTNHFHLLIETTTTEVWKFMGKLLTNYAAYFNRKYGYTGHLFEKRYTSCIIEDDIYFLEASRYIHLNPVKANMVRGPLDYEYSSYRIFMDEAKSTLLNKNKVLGLFLNNDKERYRVYVEGENSHRDKEVVIQKLMGENDNWLPW